MEEEASRGGGRKSYADAMSNGDASSLLLCERVDGEDQRRMEMELEMEMKVCNRKEADFFPFLMTIVA
jgi:hypothetical protein